MCMLSFKFAGLMMRPEKTGIVGRSRLVLETSDIANLGENDCGIDRSNAFHRCLCIEDASHLGFNQLVVIRELTLIETGSSWLHG